MKIIGLNEFLDETCKECFRCGSLDYTDIYLKDHLFRLCKKCENHPDVVRHFIQLNRGMPTTNIIKCEDKS